jgi:diguanylate cyclase (GGDEF)-like protein/PAS domain S-box-containing protein
MRASATSIANRRQIPWLRKHGSGVRLAACFFSFALTAGFVVQAARGWCRLGGFARRGFLTPAAPYILPPIFIGAGATLLYSIAMALRKEWKTVRHLKEIAALHALISTNSRDAIILADLCGSRLYGSSAAEDLEWSPEKLLTPNGLEMVHPEDRQKVQTIVDDLQSCCKNVMIECRVRKWNGEYIWVETSLRVVRDMKTGAPFGVLNIVRDVSQRKLAEQQLRDAYNAVEALAVTDALTGLPNRRRFDQYLANEWRRSTRDCQPLSLLMLDVDRFKAYNDTYGHQRGDSCLKQVAEACLDVVSRPGDMVARFGGEEFVVILPNTEDEGARHVADKICEALRSRRLQHSGNRSGIVTISAGCATLVPCFGKHSSELIEMADQALYKAKYSGRDLVCNGKIIECSGKQSPISTSPEAVFGKTA